MADNTNGVRSGGELIEMLDDKKAPKSFREQLKEGGIL